jgi:hypothetical protein
MAAWASPAPELLAATPADAQLRHPIRTIPPLRRWSAGRVALLGDAAHAMAKRASARMARLAAMRGNPARARNLAMRLAPAASRRRTVEKLVLA